MELGNWTQAVQIDGGFVMAQVTQRLYEGGNLRPDEYYKIVPSLGRMKYKNDFNLSQQKIIESCDRDFDIRDVAAEFDISLHWVLQKNTCGLKPTDDIYRYLNTLVKKRNALCHSNKYFDTDEDINEKLDDLLSLYMKILNCLEDRCFNDLTEVKRQIISSIEEKKHDHVRSPSFLSSPVEMREVVPYNRSKQKENSGWEKGLAIGGGVALAGAAVVGLASLLSSEKKSREGQGRERQRASNRTSSNEECVMM